MRKVVAYENALWMDTWFVLSGALTPGPNQIFIYWNFDHTQEPIGEANDFEREPEFGEISFELTLYDHFLKRIISVNLNDYYDYSIYANELDMSVHSGVQEVRKGTIRSVALTPKAANTNATTRN